MCFTPHPSRQAATPSPEGEGICKHKRNINAQKMINIEKFLERARESLFLKRGSRTMYNTIYNKNAYSSKWGVPLYKRQKMWYNGYNQ
jgi:hypothetical protein